MVGNDKLLSYMRDHSPRLGTVASEGREVETPSEEGSCPAFGFLRGLDARALAVEFHSRTGNRDWFAYSCLVWWRFNPSAGLMLKFTTGDGVSIVLIRGSNLDAPVGGASVNLTNRGFQRHRILWVREMDEDELRRVGEGEPTVDRINVVAFESQEKLREWISQMAQDFGGGIVVGL